MAAPEISDPILVAASSFDNEPGVDRWGFYQFPVLDRLQDGRIAVTFHINADSARAYGHGTAEPNRGLSADGGATWSLAFPVDPVVGLVLPDGSRLRAGTADITPKPVSVDALTLPPARGTVTGTYGDQPYVTYRHRELPASLQGVPVARWDEADRQWKPEQARLDDPELLRASAEGVFPVVWWGDVNLAPDGSLVALVYPCRLEGAEFGHWHCGCYRSTDGGRSWQVQGRVLYRPDRASDPLAERRDGFSEPASVVLPDGEVLAVLRTTDGTGTGPLYLSRSRDQGRTWTPPKVLRGYGVLPRLLRLANGVLVLSSGRPGADLSFSLDGRGETWTEPLPLVPVTSTDTQFDSCGYTSLLALGAETFLVAYSWFRQPAGEGRTRKAIYVRRVRVRR